jgi:hypothetical protein
MTDELLDTLIRQSELLTSDEQLVLASRLIEKARYATRPVSNMPHRKWAEIRGRVAHPLAGEDAQAWVSRSRQESDSQRESRRNRGA